MSGHFNERFASYLGSSTRKVYLARHHLAGFASALDRLNREGGFFEPAGPDDKFIEVDAHADGCVVQLFGAFDAFSCSAAWHYQLADPDRHSFRKLAGACPAELKGAVDAIWGSSSYGELRRLRHVAGHRGLVAQTRFLDTKRIGIRTAEGEEAWPILERLITWGEPAVLSLQNRVRQLQWAGHDRAYLL